MKVVERKPVPIYELTCGECGSRIQYKACEVSMLHITCPVCGVSNRALTILPVKPKGGENGKQRMEERDRPAEIR